MNRFAQAIRTSRPYVTTQERVMCDSDRDPRPDLREDHLLWASVLISAWRLNLPVEGQPLSCDVISGPIRSTIHGLLHELRCGGARLESKDKGRLHLNIEPYCKQMRVELEELRAKWLVPNKKAIVAVFDRANRGSV